MSAAEAVAHLRIEVAESPGFVLQCGVLRWGSGVTQTRTLEVLLNLRSHYYKGPRGGPGNIDLWRVDTDSAQRPTVLLGVRTS